MGDPKEAPESQFCCQEFNTKDMATSSLVSHERKIFVEQFKHANQDLLKILKRKSPVQHQEGSSKKGKTQENSKSDAF